MSRTTDGFCTINEALAELRAGRMIVLVDDEHCENEGDVIIPAKKVTPEAINFRTHFEKVTSEPVAVWPLPGWAQ